MRKTLSALAAVLSATGAAQAQDQRPVIWAETEVPPIRFALPSRPSEMLMTPEAVTVFTPPVRVEAERLLRDYYIQDPTIATSLRSALMSIAWLDKRPADLLRLLEDQRASESKPQRRQIGH